MPKLFYLIFKDFASENQFKSAKVLVQDDFISYHSPDTWEGRSPDS